MGERRAVGIGGALELAVVLPLDGVADDDRGLLRAEAAVHQAVGVGEFPDVVPVHLDDVPARREPVVEVGRGHGVEDRTVDALLVVVQRHDQVLDAERGGDVARLVGHPLFGLGVAGDHERPRGQAAGAVQNREAQPRGDAVPGRTRGRVGQRGSRFDVPARAVERAERGQILGIDRGASRFRPGARRPSSAALRRPARPRSAPAASSGPRTRRRGLCPACFGLQASKPRTPLASSVTSFSVLEDEPPGCPDLAPSTAANVRPRTTRQSSAIFSSSISGNVGRAAPLRLR